MRIPRLKLNGVTRFAFAGCSVLSSSLAASAAGEVPIDLTRGGAVQVSSPVYVVDFSTTEPSETGGSYQSLYTMADLGTGVEEGFNANGGGGVALMPGVISNPGLTRDVTIGELGALQAGGDQYGVFSLTLNEQFARGFDPARGGSTAPEPSQIPRISLDTFKVFVADTPLTAAATYTDLASNARLVFDLDNSGASGGISDRSILLDASVSSSTSGDLFVSIPIDLFKSAGAQESSYVYVYSKLGSQASFEANPGLDSWSFLRAGGNIPRMVLLPAVHAPEASTWLGALAMVGLIGGGFWYRRNRG